MPPSRDSARSPSPSNSPGYSRTTAPLEASCSLNRLPLRVAKTRPSAANATASIPSSSTRGRSFFTSKSRAQIRIDLRASWTTWTCATRRSVSRK